MKKKILKTVIILFSIICLSLILSGGAAYYVLFTKGGGELLTKQLFKAVEGPDSGIVWQKNEGSLISGMSYDNISVKDLAWFPAPNELKIQKLIIDINSLSLDGIDLYVENARLILPDADPISLQGSIKKKSVDFNIYTNSIYDTEINEFLKNDFLRNVELQLKGLDVFIRGTVEEPVLSGELIVEKIEKDGFALEQAPCTLEISFRKERGAWGLFGPLVIKKGVISGKRTALVRLVESKILFKGDPGKPAFNIKATSVVEKIKMNIAVKGDFDNPDLQVSSTPSMSRERILLALATNKTWQSTEEILSNGGMSPDLAGDFIDYFIFGGQGNKFAQKFGLKNVSVKYDDQGKGISVSKDISDRLEGTYEIEEKQNQEGPSDIKQKISGEYMVTDSVSIEAKKELKQRDPYNPEEVPVTDDQLLLKFKKPF